MVVGNAAAGGIEDIAATYAEAAAGGSGDLAEQRGVVAEFLHLVFLAVEADLGEGARVGQGAHAEEALILADAEAAAVVSGGDLADFDRCVEIVGAEDENIGGRGGSSTLRESR